MNNPLKKIARRGVTTPHIYEPDILNNIKAKQVLNDEAVIISHNATVSEVRTWLLKEKSRQQNFYVVAGDEGMIKGTISSSNLFSLHHDENAVVEHLIKRKPLVISGEDSLKTAVEAMSRENLDVLPVVGDANSKIIGVLTYRNILSVYRDYFDEHQQQVAISLKRRTLKILLHGRNKLAVLRNN